MNKRTLKLVVLIVVFGVISFLSYKIISKTQEKIAIANRIKTIPDFNLTALNNTEFKKENLKLNVPTVFLYFNSECDFCQYEVQSISDAIDKFKDIHLVFVSAEPIEKIKIFSGQYNLYNNSNITFLHDSTDSFFTQFNASSIPFTLIYDKNQNLIKTHIGQLNANGILRIINK